jgi:hypothetical protein
MTCIHLVNQRIDFFFNFLQNNIIWGFFIKNNLED